MMADDETVFERELGGQLLASVSRSFYLTLKALPPALREPISLAYLLARSADTIADTAQAPLAVRLECLQTFDALIRQPNEADERQLAARLQADFRPHQEDAAEARLMERFSDALSWLRSIDGGSREAIDKVLGVIISGQVLDIERFPMGGAVVSLTSEAELDDYTWRVAGCVGEFWTELCELELEQPFAEGVAPEQMRQWGLRMGKGLQLVNILRDVGKDATLGRCYLPRDQWKEGAASVEDLLEREAVLDPVWNHWSTQCEAHLQAGVEYVCRLEAGKVRYATALPLMLAFDTLRKLKRTPWPERADGVKISRFEVAKVLSETLVASRSEDSLRALLDRKAAN